MPLGSARTGIVSQGLRYDFGTTVDIGHQTIFEHQQITKAIRETSDYFGGHTNMLGKALSVGTNWAAITAHLATGARAMASGGLVVMCKKQTDGTWLKTEELTDPGEENDNYGKGGVFIYDDKYLLIGHPLSDEDFANGGRLHFYVLDEETDTWECQTTNEHYAYSNVGAYDYFGCSPCMTSKYIFSGAYGDDTNAGGAGIIWYRRWTDDLPWSEVVFHEEDDLLQYSLPTTGDNEGKYLAADDHTNSNGDLVTHLVSGIPKNDDMGSNRGVVVLYEKVGNEIWAQKNLIYLDDYVNPNIIASNQQDWGTGVDVVSLPNGEIYIASASYKNDSVATNAGIGLILYSEEENTDGSRDFEVVYTFNFASSGIGSYPSTGYQYAVSMKYDPVRNVIYCAMGAYREDGVDTTVWPAAANQDAGRVWTTWGIRDSWRDTADAAASPLGASDEDNGVEIAVGSKGTMWVRNNFGTQVCFDETGEYLFVSSNHYTQATDAPTDDGADEGDLNTAGKVYIFKANLEAV